MKRRFIPEANETASQDFDRLQRNRAAKLRALQSDKAFISATERIKAELADLRKKDPKQFHRYFSQLTYLCITLDPEKVRQVLAAVPKESIRTTLKEYVQYCARFHVSLMMKKRSFRVLAHAPFKSKFQVAVVNGQLRPVDLRIRAEEEPVWTDLYESNVRFPSELENLIDRGSAIGVKVEDESGRSVLNELEGFAYDPAALTFILHRGEQNYLYCLIGEKVSTNTVWREAGKVVTAIQKEFYGRTKRGRPANISNFKATIRQIKRKQSLTNTAIEMAQAEGREQEKDVAAFQVRLSRAAKATGLSPYKRKK